MKKWTLLAAIILCSSAALAVYRTSVQPLPSQFRSFRAVPNSTDLQVRAYGAEALSFDVVNRVGGVLLQGTAEPIQPNGIWLRIKQFFCDTAIVHDPSAANGSRYTFRYACSSVTLPYTDEFFAPLVEFVASDYTATVTLLGGNNNPTEQELEGARAANASYIVQYHPALKDSLLGNMMLLADAAFVDPPVLELTDHWKESLKAMWPAVQEQPSESFDSLQEFVFDSGTSECRRFSSYIIVDVDTEYRWSLADDELVIDGEPYYSFWCKYPGPREAFHYLKLPIGRAVAAAPYVYHTVLEAGRAAAFLRWLRTESLSTKGPEWLRWLWDDSDNWNDLVAETANLPIEGHETPGFFGPSESFELLELFREMIKSNQEGGSDTTAR